MALTLDGGSGIASIDASAGSPSVRGSDANTGVFYTSNKVSLSTDGTERLRMDGGILRVGHSIPGDNASGGLIVDSSGESSFYRSSDGMVLLVGGGNSGQKLIEWRHVGTGIGSVSKNGTTGINYNTSSDYRLKENNVLISDGITRLKTLKPYRFNFKESPSITVDGFFAHEVTAVPEAITGEKDGTEMQGIDQSKLVPLLTAALQEAITKIETLETKVAALEAG
tara:strand:+ start:41 stop:715 length:675 start_codon:yes stop_codon:yes gene_type:complete